MSFRNVLASMAIAMLWTFTAQAQTARPVPTAPPAPTAQGQGSVCVPNCRNGFFCNSGQCVSLCNPGCENGSTCSAQGQCIAPQPAAPQVPMAQPAPNYPVMNYAQPTNRPITRREHRRAVREQRRAEKRRRKEESRAERARLGYYRGRLYAGAHFTLGGSGYVDSRYNLTSNSDSELAYGTGTQLGLGGGLEFRLGYGFGMGPMVRYSGIRLDGTRLFDIMVTPTVHIPFDSLEIVIPLQTGIALAWTDGGENDTPGNPDPDGAGFAIGMSPGVIFWPNKSFGINANLGIAAHYIGVDGSTNRFYTINLITGINFGY